MNHLARSHRGRVGRRSVSRLSRGGPPTDQEGDGCKELDRIIKLAESNTEARVNTIADRLEVTAEEFKACALWNLGRPFDLSEDELDAAKPEPAESNKSGMRSAFRCAWC